MVITVNEMTVSKLCECEIYDISLNLRGEDLKRETLIVNLTN